jgi:hypothetical protein
MLKVWTNLSNASGRKYKARASLLSHQSTSRPLKRLKIKAHLQAMSDVLERCIADEVEPKQATRNHVDLVLELACDIDFQEAAAAAESDDEADAGIFRTPPRMNVASSLEFSGPRTS